VHCNLQILHHKPTSIGATFLESQEKKCYNYKGVPYQRVKWLLLRKSRPDPPFLCSDIWYFMRIFIKNPGNNSHFFHDSACINMFFSAKLNFMDSCTFCFSSTTAVFSLSVSVRVFALFLVGSFHSQLRFVVLNQCEDKVVMVIDAYHSLQF